MKIIILALAALIAFSIFAQGNVKAEKQSDIVNLVLESKSYLPYEKYMLGNYYKTKLLRSNMRILEQQGKKTWIEKEYKLLLDEAVPLINASNMWNSSYNGSGVKVCILDTGINKTHPAFGSRVVAEKDFVIDDGDGNSTEDFHGHGTHVAGIVASEDETYKGIAYGVQLLNAKVFSSNTTTATDSNIMNGIDWCIEQGADILSMSLGGSGTPDDLISAYADLAVDAGKIVVIAAGNSGPGGDSNCRTHEDGSSSICSPGLAHKVITVGSTKKNDAISSFSSRGPAEDGRIKPDITAPGQSIKSASRTGGWVTMSGTSMATPMAAGFAAVIKQIRPSITPEELKALIMNTAIDLGDEGKDNVYGAGRISGSDILDEINNTRKENVSTHDVVHLIDLTKSNIKATLYWPENYSVHNNLDFYLVDNYGNFIINSSSANNTDEIIKFNNTDSSGRWKLLVRPTAKMNDASGVQAHSSSQAYVIASNNPIGKQLFGKYGSVDKKSSYHKINVTNNPLSVFLDFDYLNKDIDLIIFNLNSDEEGFSLTNSSENITLNNITHGLWIVKIKNNGNSSVNYFITSDNSISENFTDESPPNITITSPANKTYNNETINLTFSITEDINKSATCEGILGNASIFKEPVISGSAFSKPTAVDQGFNTIHVSCTDDDNNTATKNVSFTVDSAIRIIFNPPTPNNEVFYFSSTVTINASSENLDTLILEWNGVNETVPGNLSTRIIIKGNLEDGNYTFRLFANDSSGNTNVSETRWVFINFTRNKEEIFSKLGINFELLNLTSESVNTSKLFPFEKYKLKFNLPNLSINIFNFFVDDLNGTANITQNISLPFSAVIAEIIWIDFDLIEKGKYTASIDFSNLHKLFFYLNGTKDNFTYARITDTCNLNITNTPCINSSAMFLPSFSGAAAVTDLKAPELVINAPIPTTYTSTSVELFYNVGDNIEVDSCWYSLNGINITLPGCTNTTINASAGSNVLTLFANDSSGNINQTSVTFTVSLPAPPASSSSSSSGNSGGGSSSPAVVAQPAPPRQNITQPKPAEQPAQEEENSSEETHNDKVVQIENNNEKDISNIPITGLAAESNTDYMPGLAIFTIIVLGGVGFYIYKKRF